MDATTASALAFLVADCRIYSTIRDQTLLTDENSTVIVAEMKDWKSHEQDLSDAADAIIADLRNSGINI